MTDLKNIITLTFLFWSASLCGQPQDNVHTLRLKVTDQYPDSTVASSAIRLANYYKERNVDSAYYFIDLAQQHIDTAGASEISARYHYTSSKIYFKEGKGDLSLSAAQRANQLITDESDLELKGDILIAISRAYFSRRDYERSQQYATEAEETGIAHQDSFLITSSLDIRGNIMRMTKRWDQSITYFEAAAEINKTMGRKKSAARNLANIATVYSVTKKFERSIPYYKEVITIAEEENDSFLRAFASGNLGMNYVELEQPDSAQIFLEDALQQYQKMNNRFRIIGTQSRIARLHMSQKNYKAALDILLPAYKSSKELTDIKLTDDLAFNIGDSYEQMGNYKLANKYHRIHMSLQDSMINQQVTDAVNEAEAKYETDKKEAEIQRLSLEDELNEIRISRQRFALGGSVVGLGILSFLLYRLFGQNKKISTQNTIITKANAEKEVLLKEIHHRVKNNLQVISSLLGLQSLSIKDQAAKDAIQEGRSRVHSMSLIHQNLYKKDNLTGIEMEPYVQKLCRDLINTYHVGDTKITFYEEVQDGLILDVETVVPLGLIINELVTNSLKYAFMGRERGLISVILKEDSQSLLLTVSDNGIGLKSDISTESTDSFGHSLIRAFRDKLDAEIEITGEDGVTVSLRIKHYKKV